jgi:predicted Zn-dependent protease with MMP-like domain
VRRPARVDNVPGRRQHEGMKRMSLERFGRIVAGVMETLPEEFKPYLENLVVDVEEQPDERTLREQGFTPEQIADGESLYGLFCPFPIADGPDFGGVAPGDLPLHRIIVFKNPLEEDFPDRRELRREIRKTVIHELAHHFGYTERDLEPFESKDDPFGDEAD